MFNPLAIDIIQEGWAFPTFSLTFHHSTHVSKQCHRNTASDSLSLHTYSHSSSLLRSHCNVHCSQTTSLRQLPLGCLGNLGYIKRSAHVFKLKVGAWPSLNECTDSPTRRGSTTSTLPFSKSTIIQKHCAIRLGISKKMAISIFFDIGLPNIDIF